MRRYCSSGLDSRKEFHPETLSQDFKKETAEFNFSCKEQNRWLVFVVLFCYGFIFMVIYLWSANVSLTITQVFVKKIYTLLLNLNSES